MLTQRVLYWIENNQSARILNLFDDVCNLVNDKGDLISLAASIIGPGPFTMVMDRDFHQELSKVEMDQPVALDWPGKRISIGSQIFVLNGASLWNATPLWSKLRQHPYSGWPPSATLPAAVQDPLSKLLSAIAADDYIAASAAVNSLAGLGQGLTPAGDDVLMGIIYALWIWHPEEDLIDLIVETAAPRTTTLSAAYLYAAAAGEAAIHWHELTRGDSTAPSKILAVGESSGSDSWSGFIQARDFLAASEGKDFA